MATLTDSSSHTSSASHGREAGAGRRLDWRWDLFGAALAVVGGLWALTDLYAEYWTAVGGGADIDAEPLIALIVAVAGGVLALGVRLGGRS